jgi:hypothetical protein
MERQEILTKLERIFTVFCKHIGREINYNNFEDIDLRKSKIGLTELYDFEIMVEAEFFNEQDMIPDNLFTTIKDLCDFIKIQKDKEEEQNKEKEKQP